MPDRQASFHIGAQSFEAPALPPGLYLVATPIGNLGDITVRALQTLAAAHVIYCEDTRVTIRLMERYGIRNTLKACHEHNETRVAPAIIDAVRSGKVVALASDAGTPLISDPGYRVVQACVDQGVSVTALPGASAVLAALQLSGLATDSFTFVGFLPQKKSERRMVLENHASDRATLVAYESPHRILDALADIQITFGSRKVAVARELTKLHEEVLRGSAADIAATLGARASIKGEFVVVIEAGEDVPATLPDTEINAIIADAAKALPASKAAQQVAKLTGLSREAAYARIIKLKSAT